MTTFHEGQEVEVLEVWSAYPDFHEQSRWSKAKILGDRPLGLPGYWVQFRDGTRTVFDAEHIRAVAAEPSGKSSFIVGFDGNIRYW